MNEPVAIRYDFDGYGYQYMDSGSGSDWQTRVDGELLYADPVKELPTKEDEYWLMVEMLRARVKEQQAEINALKKEAALQRLSDFTQEAEHEPVAWLWTKDGKPQSALLHEPDTVPSDPYWKDKGFKAIPLYLHPVKELHLSLQKSKQTGELLAITYTDDEHRIVEVLWQRPPIKELTDEEIYEVWHDLYERWEEEDTLKFARAILRKAQEK